MPSKASVLQIVTAPVLGGAQAVLCALAEDQRRQGLEVAAATSPGGPLAAHLREAGFAVLETPMDTGLRLRSVLELRRLVRRRGVRLVHAHGARALLHAYGATRALRGVRLVGHVHLFDAWRFDGSRRARVDRHVSSRCDRVIACSEMLRGELVARQGLPPARTVTIPNGIDVERFAALPPRAEARARLGLPQDALAAGTCVRLEPTKGVAYLLEAAARLADALPRLHLLVAGDGSERAALEQQARAAGLAGRVHWLGFRDDVREVLAALDVFVLPSLVEGLPLSVIEAMAAGVPVVATRIAGTSELLGEDRGRGVEPGSAEALARALAELAAQPETRRALAARARAHVRERHSLEAMCRGVCGLYAELGVGGED